MEEHIIYLNKIRREIIDELSQHTLDQLLYIPVGYKNNIFWNAAHVLATQQLVHYYLSENRMLVDMEFIRMFKKGTFGNNSSSEEDVKELIELLESTPMQLHKDYRAEKLSRYRTYQTSFGIELNCIEDAILYNNIHEAMHLGYILSLKKNIPF
ncbi:DinB family protein [Faecalibacter rhinopitheci]|uniref:DinB family protein n=1 Tax=Faecalibacter rhinopitheci TaxID=2779678 RepID=A0A8J7FQF4_9FLAO|nr:DinB family protein [Faecalibacter rhinopitheci]MBF0597609.1 DinB family protein [Faecalibacter rhinopitheci]MBQ0148601.1 DinB family protein [Candidatus Onthonaster equi]